MDEKSFKFSFKRALKRMLMSIIFIILGVYIGLTLLLFIMQDKMVYHPYKEITATPDKLGLKYENVFFSTKDGIKLNAWFVHNGNSKGTVLFCHGNAGNVSYFLDAAEAFNKAGLNCLLFDYRQFGLSEGSISEKGTYQDVEAAWNYLTETMKIEPDKIIISGRSLGGSVAAYMASKQNPAGLILESSFLSVPEMGADLYPFFPVKFLARIKHPTIKFLEKVKCPVLIIHSPDDEIVKFRHGKALFDNAPGKKEFVELNGDHNGCYMQSEDKYIATLKKFASLCLGEADK